VPRLVDELIASHRGRIFNAADDSVVAVRHLFKTAISAEKMFGPGI
jgi:hypothetical protein